MISYQRDTQQKSFDSSVKIIGLGGAGANIIDRAALDGAAGAEMVCINTDIRTLNSSVAGEKIQLGKNLTKGLGTGGDPAVGLKAGEEAELEIRNSLNGKKIVFLCVGLGGGTGSGAAPLICRIAREVDAFVVVFATVPFSFEGQRRKEQAETALNELAVLANALVTFDNGRMGELILAKQGIHEAFAASDRMISESIKAVTRLVVCPGLINVGLDDLVSALDTTHSRCLFGSGIADGENRTQLALDNALSSPLLDKGSLLESATTVLIHICGGESMTLYEIELLMRKLSKHVPESANILFGAAVDSEMGENLSVTLISALPEEKLLAEPAREKVEEPVEAEEAVIEEEEPETEEIPKPTKVYIQEKAKVSLKAEPYDEAVEAPEKEKYMEPSEGYTKSLNLKVSSPEPVAEPLEDEINTKEEVEPELPDEEIEIPEPELEKEEEIEELTPPFAEVDDTPSAVVTEEALPDDNQKESAEDPKLNLDDKPPIPTAPKSSKSSQGELELDGGPKGKFEGSSPNIHDGEDLDVPAFLRRRRR